MIQERTGWLWVGTEGYCPKCVPYDVGEECGDVSIRTYLESGLAVDYCCNCTRKNNPEDPDYTPDVQPLCAKNIPCLRPTVDGTAYCAKHTKE